MKWIGAVERRTFCSSMIWPAILIVLLIIQGSAFASDGLGLKYPDVFAHGNINIASGQMIGRLLVTGGNATVSGTVEKGIVVVDGNLFLTSDAHVKGTVLVLGGYAERGTGSRLEKSLVVLAPGKTPVAGFLVSGLLLFVLSSLFAVPALAWLIARIVKNAPLYFRLKERWLRVERNWSAFNIAFVAAIGVLLLTFFAEMAYETLIRHQMDFFDNVIVWLVRYLASPELDRAMIVISEYGYGLPFGVLILIAMGTLIFYRQWLETASLLVCLVGEALLNLILKNIFERSRPDLFRVVQEAGYSFPSGHAMVSICFYGMATFLIVRHIQNWSWRLAVIVFSVALIATIGVSRVYLGVHYPTDVVAGYFAGGMWLAFCISLLLWWGRRLKK